jgi:RIO kinase 1
MSEFLESEAVDVGVSEAQGVTMDKKQKKTMQQDRHQKKKRDTAMCFNADSMLKDPLENTSTVYDASDFSEDDLVGFDDLESELLGEDLVLGGGGGAKGRVAELNQRLNLSTRIQNDITRSEKKGEKQISHYGKDDRATSEQVLDPRTRLILFKLLSSGFLNEIDGCLSTGKEANVYYATGRDGREYAVKIFKTSILVFKDRDRYVSGEYRFRNGYCKSNPRKMVRIWAEKEMRNLKRLAAANIPCPFPYLLKSHVLIMDFLGTDGWCAPRIKDAELSFEDLTSSYATIVVDMHRMYHDCNLVHGDLSEYNLLWHNGRAVIIDVSQSVEHAHPYANDFLRKDIYNVTDFFRKRGVTTLSNYNLFMFITKREHGRDNALEEHSSVDKLHSVLSEMLASAIAEEEEEDNEGQARAYRGVGESGDDSSDEESRNRAAIDEAVFLQSYIPTSLHEFSNPQAELKRLQTGQREQIYESAINEMLGRSARINNQASGDANVDKSVEEAPRQVAGDAEEERDGSESDGDSNTSYSSSDSEGNKKYRRRLPTTDDPAARAAMKAAKKEARRLAKAEAAMKRTKKIPKHVKKRAVKSGKK